MQIGVRRYLFHRGVFRAAFFAFLFSGVGLLHAADDTGETFASPVLSQSSFNPTQEETVAFSIEVGKKTTASVYVVDGERYVVRTLAKSQAVDRGKHRFEWDGKDDRGKVVPNEAYTFVIETDDEAVFFDPFVSSGGVVGDVTDASFNSSAGTVTYRIPSSARVLARFGIHNGPMLKTLVDWEPRLGGTVTEYWNGKDEDGTQVIRGMKSFTALITYVTLPDATVVTFGNSDSNFLEFYTADAQRRKQLAKRARRAEERVRLMPANLVPSVYEKSPSIELALADEPSEGIPAVGKEIRVRITADERSRTQLQKEQFEIIFFVDNVFFAEAERGYLPYNWNWELSQLPPGEHLLTVNVSTFGGQVGVASKKIYVKAG
ncbi:hypothetical protein MRY87_13660 [bacterium]|nr:hypothetical protein [bacterium]